MPILKLKRPLKSKITKFVKIGRKKTVREKMTFFNALSESENAYLCFPIFYISQTLCYFTTKRLCTMICDSKETPVKQNNLNLYYPLGFHFFPIVHSPFSKSVNQIKKESQPDTLWKSQIAEGNAGKYKLSVFSGGLSFPM